MVEDKIIGGITPASIKADYESNQDTNEFSDAEQSLLASLNGHVHDGRYFTQAEVNSLLSAKEDAANKGNANGYAELDGSGLVPNAQLPSYVDDVLEYADFASLPGAGETGKIYVTIDDGKTFRWSGSAYTEISASLALGETSGTAYRGDRGKTAYDHSQVTHDKTLVGLGNVDNTSDVNKPISSAMQTALDAKPNEMKDDTTPELGGELNCGEHSIVFGVKDNGNSGAAKTIDWRLSNIQKIVLTGNCTLTFTAPSNGAGLTLLVTQDATGGRDITLPGTCKVLGTAPTFTDGGASKSMILSFRLIGSTYWYQGSEWET